MIKRFSSLAMIAAVAATATLSGCAADGEGATEQLAREEVEYTTGSNLPRKTGRMEGVKTLSAKQATDLIQNLEVINQDSGAGK